MLHICYDKCIQQCQESVRIDAVIVNEEITLRYFQTESQFDGE